jgi:hypothetical protein
MMPEILFRGLPPMGGSVSAETAFAPQYFVQISPGCLKPRPQSTRNGAMQKLNLKIMPQLRRRIVNSYLKHGKPALQFDRTGLGALLRRELSLQATINF